MATASTTAAASGVPWRNLSPDQMGVVTSAQAKARLLIERQAWNKAGSMANRWVQRALDLTGYTSWVSDELKELLAEVLLACGTDMFLIQPPGWGKTVLAQMALMATTGVRAATFPLKSLTQQVHAELLRLCDGARARGFTPPAVYVIEPATFDTGDPVTGEASREALLTLQMVVNGTERNTAPGVILLFTPDLWGRRPVAKCARACPPAVLFACTSRTRCTSGCSFIGPTL